MLSNRVYSVIRMSTTVSQVHVSLKTCFFHFIGFNRKNPEWNNSLFCVRIKKKCMQMHKISFDIMNHCQVEDTDEVLICHCCSMKTFWHFMADVDKILFLKIKAFPIIHLKAWQHWCHMHIGLGLSALHTCVAQ